MARKIIGEILRDNRRFFSLNFAASQCGYSKEYFRQLILKERLKAEMINNNWFISEDELIKLRQQLGANNLVKNENDEITELKKEIKRLNDHLESHIVVSPDPWDRALLEGERSYPLPQKPSGFPNLQTFKSAAVKSLSVVLIIFASVFFTKNFDRAAAGVLLAGRQAQLAAASLQEIAVGTAADIQETALNLPDQARSFAEQTLNQFYSLSLSLSRQTS